jgi:hypothetical protein
VSHTSPDARAYQGERSVDGAMEHRNAAGFADRPGDLESLADGGRNPARFRSISPPHPHAIDASPGCEGNDASSR